MHLEAAGYWPRLQIRKLVSSHAEILLPGLCCLISLACILSAHPFADSASVDDWSYADVALRFAQTGSLHYNGWGSPMIIFQSIWGAAWIWLFGFSFNVLRIATIPFSIAFVLVVYLVGRQAGLTLRNASFGAVLAGTSPLFLPLSASFMTEPYACFFTALCLYAAMRGIETFSASTATAWLWILTAAGIVGGAERQSVWAAPAVLIPLLFWSRRCDFRFRRHAIASYTLLAVCIAALSFSFKPPLYAPFQFRFSELMVTAAYNWRAALGDLVSLTLSWALFMLPVGVCFAGCSLKLGADRIVLLLLASATVGFVLLLAFGSVALAPFKGDIVSPFGVLTAGEDALGYKPAVLPVGLRFAVTTLVIFSVAAIALNRGKSRYLTPQSRAVFRLFTCSYALILIPGMILNRVPDRYLLPLIPVSAIALLATLQGQNQDRRGISWIVLLLFAVYGTATTHDFSSALRARVTVAKMLEVRGIAKRRISAGLEYDGWTQIQSTGRITSILRPVPLDAKDTQEFWFWRFTTALRPEYVVAYSQLPGAESGLPSASFGTWLPPFERYVTVFKRVPAVAAPGGNPER